MTDRVGLFEATGQESLRGSVPLDPQTVRLLNGQGKAWLRRLPLLHGKRWAVVLIVRKES